MKKSYNDKQFPVNTSSVISILGISVMTWNWWQFCLVYNWAISNSVVYTSNGGSRGQETAVTLTRSHSRTKKCHQSTRDKFSHFTTWDSVSKEKSPSWKYTSRSADQEISKVLNNLLTIVCHFSAYNQINQHTYFFTIHFNIILYLGLGPFFTFSSSYIVSISHLSYALHLRSSHTYSADRSDIGWRVIMKCQLIWIHLYIPQKCRRGIQTLLTTLFRKGFTLRENKKCQGETTLRRQSCTSLQQSAGDKEPIRHENWLIIVKFRSGWSVFTRSSQHGSAHTAKQKRI